MPVNFIESFETNDGGFNVPGGSGNWHRQSGTGLGGGFSLNAPMWKDNPLSISQSIDFGNGGIFSFYISRSSTVSNWDFRVYIDNVEYYVNSPGDASDVYEQFFFTAPSGVHDLKFTFTGDSSYSSDSPQPKFFLDQLEFFEINDIYSEIASGGIDSGGEIIPVLDFITSGGLISSGNFEVFTVFANAASAGGRGIGGLEPSGVSDFFSSEEINAEGGVNVSGVSLVADKGIESSGGLVSSGFAQFALEVPVSGGITTNGLVELEDPVIVGVGGITPAGLVLTDANYTLLISGGVSLGGVDLDPEFEVASGGTTLGGESFFEVLKDFKFPSGGSVLGGLAQVSLTSNGLTEYIEIANGGMQAGGNFAEFLTSLVSGLFLSGEAELNAAERFEGNGGITVDVDVENQAIFQSIIDGSLTLEGSPDLSVVIKDFEVSGLLNLDGEAFVQSGIIGEGGITSSGNAPIRFIDSVEETLDGEGAIVGGYSVLTIDKKFDSSGGLSITGNSNVVVNYTFASEGFSDDTPPDYAAISVGYLNNQNPTITIVSYNIDRTFTWGVNKALVLDTTIAWNTGTLPLFFYRVVGSPQFDDECDPISGVGDCCQQFILNVPARSVTDLCEKLKNRRWKWPVLLVQKFSRPAENALVDPDDECNILEEVEICNNVVCEDFCVDYDVKETWGVSTKTQLNAFYIFEASGDEIAISGFADIDVFYEGSDLFHEAEGELTIEGSGVYFSDFIDSFGGLRLGGSVTAESSSWYFVGGDWPLVSNAPPQVVEQLQEESTDSAWVDPTSAILSDNLRASADTSNGDSTNFLIIKDFDFNLPVDAKIIGIEASIERFATASVQDNAIHLVLGDEIISDNMASGMTWPIGLDVQKVYGGIGEVWRDPNDIDYLGEWDIEDVNDPTFGIAIRVSPTASQVTSAARIDSVELKVYWEYENHHLSISGESDFIADNYVFESNQDLIFLSGDSLIETHVNYISTGRGSVGPNFSAITMSGTHGFDISYEATGGLTLGGLFTFGPGGLNISGQAFLETSSHYWETTGELEINGSGTYVVVFEHPISGDITIGGEAAVDERHYLYEFSGALEVSGTGEIVSSDFSFISDGNAIFIFGEVDTNFVYIGEVESSIGWSDEIQDLSFQFIEEPTPVDLAPGDTVTQCSCNEMSLVMPLQHNFDSGNRFEKFISKNGIAYSNFINLHWSAINSSWLANQSFEGISASGDSNRELWTLIFQLQCANSVGGEVLDVNIWRFSVQIIQKDLVTMADYDTRLLVSFLPDDICDGGFEVKLEIDTQNDFAFLTPNATIYEYKLHDNANLFKNQYWMLNPILNFELSQIGIGQPLDRFRLNV